MTGERAASDFTRGRILSPLVRFMIPVFFSMLIQSLYGAVDLLIVGKFASSVDVSAVATGSQILFTLTNLVASFSMGTTILLGQMIGQGRGKEGGDIIGASLCLFAAVALVFTGVVPLAADALASVMNAPEEAFGETVAYLRICGAGCLFIIAYNLIGSVFRGIGDSKTPLVTVVIASVFNIFGDLLLVAVCKMGTRGAAIATVAAQALSVVISFFLIRRKTLPFTFRREQLRFDGRIIGRVTLLGLPIALQDLLVGVSFLIITAIVNDLGLTASAAIDIMADGCAGVQVYHGIETTAVLIAGVGVGQCAAAIDITSYYNGTRCFLLADVYGNIARYIGLHTTAIYAAAYISGVYADRCGAAYIGYVAASIHVLAYSGGVVYNNRYVFV